MIPVLSLDMEDPLEFIEKYGSFEVVKFGHNLAIFGKKMLDRLSDMDLKIIVDLKFCDIPSTVARSVKSWDHPSVIGFTVHSLCGIESVRAAVENTSKHVFSVIKLTSQPGNMKDYMTTIEKIESLGGSFVLPGKWATALREKIRGAFLVPGIRISVPSFDQRDTVTLDEIKDAADYAVLGREIYLSSDPKAKIEEVRRFCGS